MLEAQAERPTVSPFVGFLLGWAVLAVAFAVTGWLLSGMDVCGGVWGYIWVSAIFGLVNAVIGTFLRIVTLPFRLVTLGLISLLRERAAPEDHGRDHRPPLDRRVLLDRDLGGDHPGDRHGRPAGRRSGPVDERSKMSTRLEGRPAARRADRWVTFAGLMMILAGAFKFSGGLWALTAQDAVRRALLRQQPRRVGVALAHRRRRARRRRVRRVRPHPLGGMGRNRGSSGRRDVQLLLDLRLPHCRRPSPLRSTFSWRMG